MCGTCPNEGVDQWMQATMTQKRTPSFIGLLFQPREQFDRMEDRPVIGFPLLFIVISSMFLTGFAAFWSASSFAWVAPYALWAGIGAAIGMLVYIPAKLLITTALSWVFMELFDGEATFRQLFCLHVHLNILMVLGSAVNLLLFVTLGTGTQPSVWIGAEGWTGALLAQLDPFHLWMLVLLFWGLVGMGRLGHAPAVGAVLVQFVLSLMMYGLGSSLGGIE